MPDDTENTVGLPLHDMEINSLCPLRKGEQYKENDDANKERDGPVLF